MSTDKISAKCSKCGGTQFSRPTDPGPDDKVTCVGCSASWRYADFHAEFGKASKEFLDKLVAERFAGRKGWKITKKEDDKSE